MSQLDFGIDRPPNRVVFDLELARRLPTYAGRPDFTRAPECGISALVCWGANDLSPTVVIGDSKPFRDMRKVSHKLSNLFPKINGLVSWNGVNFDNDVLAAFRPSWTELEGGRQHIDLFALCVLSQAKVQFSELERGLSFGVQKNWEQMLPPQHDIRTLFRGWGLDAVGKATLGIGKSKGFAGKHAPKKWEQGFIAEVISYCIRDVALTRALYLHAWANGWLESAIKGRVKIERRFL